MLKIIASVADNFTDDTYNYLCLKIREKYGECEIVRVNDATLIGGFTVNVNGRVFDYSVKGRLHEFKRYIKK